MTEPILETLVPAEIAEALQHYVMRRNGQDPAVVRTLARVSWPKASPPPAAASVFVEPAPPAPPEPTKAVKTG